MKKAKVIVITGASSGIGKVTSKYLTEKGNIVYGLSRSIGDIDGVNYISTDITKLDAVVEAFEKIYATEGRIDVIVNNAGLGVSGAVEYSSIDEFDKIFNLNIKALVSVCQVAIPYLRQSKGKIVNIGSVAGAITIPFQAYYSMTKAAVASLSEALRMELKPFGIKVTTVMPGDTKTEFSKNRQLPTINEDDIYKDRIKRSIQNMESDEIHGANPIDVAKVINKVIKKKNPPVSITVGFAYKFLVFLKKILPSKFVYFIVYHMYGK